MNNSSVHLPDGLVPLSATGRATMRAIGRLPMAPYDAPTCVGANALIIVG
jgi:hypothetical protein